MVWRDGVHVAGTVLWCDARRARDLSFLSHAHVGARSAHGKVLATERTLSLLGSSAAGETLVTPFARPFSLGAVRLELFPSGHLPGAASLRVEAGGLRVVYAGDVNPRAGLGEPMAIRDAEVLVLEAPLAPLEGELPPRDVAAKQLCEAVARAREGGMTPVVLAPALGGAQEAIAILGAEGFVLRAHRSIADGAAAYRTIGIDLPSVKRYSASSRDVLVWPLALGGSPPLGRLHRPRLIAVTGLALDKDAARRLGVDEVVPLSDHADRAGLLAYIAHSEAREVWFTDGWCEAIARALKARRVVALPLGPPRQMDLFA